MFIYTRLSTQEQKLSYLVICFKIVYRHLTCTVDMGGASILSPGNVSTKENSTCQTVDMTK